LHIIYKKDIFMKKRFFLIVAVLGMATVATVNVNLSLNSQSGSSDMVLANAEALSGENPMDAHAWYVYAHSSTWWECTEGGKSACPAP
jgi:hypothetical protein